MDAWTPDAIADAALKLRLLGPVTLALLGVFVVSWRHGWPWPFRDGWRRGGRPGSND